MASLDLDWKIKHAQDVIFSAYGDKVSVDAKKKDLDKFGENLLVGTTGNTIMTLPSGVLSETMLTADSITHAVSTSAADVQAFSLIEGHTYNAGDLTFNNSNTPTLTGQTGKALTTALARLTRARLASPAVGTISFYQGGAAPGGVPGTPANVHLIIPPGEIQSQKCSTSISSVDYWIIDKFSAGMLEKTGSWVKLRIEIKPANSATGWYPITKWCSVTDSSGDINFLADSPLKIVPKNHDMRVFGKANASNTSVNANVGGFLASVIS